MLIPPLKVSLTQRFATNSGIYQHLKRQMTPFECFFLFSVEDQIEADNVKKQLEDLSLKVHTTIRPVFVSRKIEQELNVKETKPPVLDEYFSVLFMVINATCVMRVM